MRRLVAASLFSLTLTACSGALQWTPSAPNSAEPVPAGYVVKPGDTLFSIAWRYGLDYHDMAVWNRLGTDYLIHPGNKLTLIAPPSTLSKPAGVTHKDVSVTPPSAGMKWLWPADGQLVRLFHADNVLAKGIDISAAHGADIRAAAAGKVVYAGSGIVGYGKLIIIKNSEDFLSAYADNDEILVREGDSVHLGDRIATMGLGRDNRPVLHFEIRYNGRPVDPLSYLPRR